MLEAATTISPAAYFAGKDESEPESVRGTASDLDGC